MSRTFRRKDGQGWWYGHRDLKWCLRDWIRIPNSYKYEYFYHDPTSKEGIKRIARFHSDAATYSGGGKAHGPSWFINEFVQRPYRRKAKRELHKYIRDEEYEVMIEDKPKRIYWD